MKAQLSHSRSKKRFRIALIALLVIGVGWLAPKTISMISSALLYPVHGIHLWLEESSSFIPVTFRDRRDLLAEIERLEQLEVVSGRSDLTAQRLWQENTKFRKLLGAEPSGRVAAGVVARPNELPYDLLQIDRGSNHGISVGAPVFIGDDIVIGLVAHVSFEYSFVELFTSHGFSATSFVLGPNMVADLEGMGGGVARVRLPQGVSLREGDLVVLPSIEPGMFGEIVRVENESTQPEQFGYVAPNISLASLHIVSVGPLSQIAQSPSEIDQAIREEIRKSLVVPNVLEEGATTTATSTEDEIAPQ